MILEQGKRSVSACPMPGATQELGLFETFKGALKGNAYVVLALKLHMNRLRQSAKVLKLSMPDDSEIESGVLRGVSDFSAECLTLRVIITQSSWWITAYPWLPRFAKNADGISLLPLPSYRLEPEHKKLSAEVSKKSFEEAKSKNFDEALLVDEKGIIREGSWSNFFWIDESGEIFTSEREMLPGVTRRVLLENTDLNISFRDLGLKDLKNAVKGAFITNAMHGVVEVKKIGDSPIPTNQVAHQAIKAYKSLYDENSSLLTTFPL